jgi:hypothetical protein
MAPQPGRSRRGAERRPAALASPAGPAYNGRGLQTDGSNGWQAFFASVPLFPNLCLQVGSRRLALPCKAPAKPARSLAPEGPQLHL